jgi:hypothetical protein
MSDPIFTSGRYGLVKGRPEETHLDKVVEMPCLKRGVLSIVGKAE